MTMGKHSHQFVEEYDGLVGFGLDRETNEYTLTYYLQKFSDDQLMELIRGRMSDPDLEELFNLLGRFLREYLTEKEYHKYFIREDD